MKKGRNLIPHLLLALFSLYILLPPLWYCDQLRA